MALYLRVERRKCDIIVEDMRFMFSATKTSNKLFIIRRASPFQINLRNITSEHTGFFFLHMQNSLDAIISGVRLFTEVRNIQVTTDTNCREHRINFSLTVQNKNLSGFPS